MKYYLLGLTVLELLLRKLLHLPRHKETSHLLAMDKRQHLTVVNTIQLHEQAHTHFWHFGQRIVVAVCIWVLCIFLGSKTAYSLGGRIFATLLWARSFDFWLRPLFGFWYRSQESQADYYAKQQSSAAEVINDLQSLNDCPVHSFNDYPVHSLTDHSKLHGSVLQLLREAFVMEHPRVSCRIRALAPKNL